MLRNSSVLHLQWRENFLNGCPVIYISDSSMLMQETVISFKEVMQTKLKIKLFISRFSTQSWPLSIWQSRLAFQAKDFFSNSWFVVVFVGYLKCFAFGYMIERISSAIMLEFLLCKNRESIFSLTLSAWFCPGDHKKWPPADTNLLGYQTKLKDKNIMRNSYFPCEISFCFKSCVW